MAFKTDTEALILGVLQGGALHGYEITKRVKSKSEALFSIGEGRLYPALHKLETEGKVSSSWQPTEGKPPRRIYELTEEGRAALVEQKAKWNQFSSSVGSILMLGAEGKNG